MESQSITRATPTRTPKKRKNQLPIAITVAIGVVGLALILGMHSPGLAIAWIFGILFGIVLQKSRFCFTASFRDPVLTGGTSLTKAVLIAIAVALAGFAIIQYSAFQSNHSLPGAINPAGWHIAIGAFIFGIGAVISGGCASGTLMRVGEGFMMQWLSLIFFVVGSLWGTHDFGWWQKVMIDKAPKIHLPSVLGWPLALLIEFGALGFLYALAHWWGKKRAGE